MTRRILSAAACATSLLGCAQPNKQQSNGQIDPDSPLISETVEPKIDFETYVAAAKLAETRGQLPSAARQYQLALKARPNDAPTLRRLAIVQTTLGQTEPAVKTWKQYVAAHESADGFGGLGYSLELAGKSDEASATYEQGLIKFPNSELIRVNYGLLLARNGKEADAIDQLKVVLKPAAVEYNLASVYEQQGRLPEAKAHYATSLALDPKLIAAQERLAKLE